MFLSLAIVIHNCRSVCTLPQELAKLTDACLQNCGAVINLKIRCFMDLFMNESINKTFVQKMFLLQQKVKYISSMYLLRNKVHEVVQSGVVETDFIVRGIS